ncbi:MAG: 4Fe-4S binding protein [Candidatus Bathyarchaeota archaeon]|nr:4Fe-4S binding protein [Candidatus Bathyarchaeota archaeon]
MSEKNDWTREELEKEYVNTMTAVTIPVNIHIAGQQRILDLSEMKEILKEANLISLGTCDCRRDLKRCDAPLDVCISLNKEAEDMIKKGVAKKANLEEVLKALERSHAAGLVHIAYTFDGNEKPDVVCSCCSCCCHSMSALVRFGMPEAVIASKYVALNKLEICVNCGTCVERCQFRARRLENGKLVYDKAGCFGCGVCVSTCPTKSISLVKRN